MLPTQRNQQTMDILRRLREQGMPKPGAEQIGTVSLDMTSSTSDEGGDDDTAVPPTDVTGKAELRPKKKKRRDTALLKDDDRDGL